MTFRLANLSIGNRIAITFIIVLAVLFALALIGYLSGRWDEDTSDVMSFQLESAMSRPITLSPLHAQELEPCMDAEVREKVREIMLTALNDALHDHIVNVFTVWLRDNSGQPDRARQGVKQGISAYVRSRKGMQNWNPPECRTQ